jgi:lactate dehydrogenase-like 2-hydroxyacid dehydrogenase
VAEHAVTLLLASIKQVNRIGEWRARFSPRGLYRTLNSGPATETRGAHNWANLTTDTLYKKQIGIVGYGLIGHQIRRRLSGFNAKIVYYNRNPYPQKLEDAVQIEYRDIDALFAECDAIFVQFPLTSQTENVIGAKLLMNCRNRPVLVNCGRAAVIDQEALYRALKSGRVGYYAADVFWREPMPLLTKFRLLKNCWITPHMAESLAKRQHDLVDKAVGRLAQYETKIGPP